MINHIMMKDGKKISRPVKNRKEYLTLRNTASNVKNFYLARNGDGKAKRNLRQFNYNAILPNGQLKGARLVSSTFAHDIDCANEEECKKIAQIFLDKKKEIGLLELSISSGWGLHAVCRREHGKTILENQVRLATITESEMDTSAHDLQRVMFTGPATDDVLLYLDDAIFDEPMDEEESKKESAYLKEREKNGEEEVPPEAKKMNKHYRVPSSKFQVPSSKFQVPSGQDGQDQCYVTYELNPDLTFKGLLYSDIISEWFKQTGGEPQEGERNVRLYQLAVSLRAICDNKKEILMQIIPRYGLDDRELKSIIDSACKEEPKGINKVMRNVLRTLNGSSSDDDAFVDADEHYQAQNEKLTKWGKQIETLSNHFPVLKDICNGLKYNQYPAALFVAGGLLMTLMTRCTYRFYHRPQELRRLNNSTLIIGDPASGKSFATRLFSIFAKPINDADQEGINALNAYREDMKTKGANKEKPKKPKVIIRIHPARTSNAQFIQDMVNAVEDVDGKKMQLHMLTFDTELDNTLSLQKGGAYIDKQSLQLKAFHNELDGQAYSNNDSVFQNFYVIWNFIYTGTPIALRKMVNTSNFGSGLATRLTCIPLPSTNFEMMDREEEVDYESDARLAEWAERLDKMKGELSLRKIVDELYEWTARRMADAKMNRSRADEMLLKRCAYHGINFAAPFIVMRHWDQMHQDGNYWCGEFETDDIDWQLAELIVNIQYECQKYFFGPYARNYFEDQHREAVAQIAPQEATKVAFARLPEVFTALDVMRCFGSKNEEAARNAANRLVADHLATKYGDGRKDRNARNRYKKL